MQTTSMHLMTGIPAGAFYKDGCQMKELYKMRADDFYAFDDRNNCRRIFDEIVTYMSERGLHEHS